MPETKFWIEQILVLFVFGVPGGLFVIWLYGRIETMWSNRTAASRARHERQVARLVANDMFLMLELAEEMRLRAAAAFLLVASVALVLVVAFQPTVDGSSNFISIVAGVEFVVAVIVIALFIAIADRKRRATNEAMKARARAISRATSSPPTGATTGSPEGPL